MLQWVKLRMDVVLFVEGRSGLLPVRFLIKVDIFNAA